jgi:ADP-ribosyl-[dinitrogen reductase] hydrolase
MDEKMIGAKVIPRTLTGLAIGDALGQPFEMVDHGHPTLVAWDGSFQPCPDTHPFCKGLKAGQWTDDTKMALALAKSIVDHGGFDPSAAAAEYLSWYRSGDHRGMGTATKAALSRLDLEVHHLGSGELGAEGNGTAMRIAPLGLALHGLPDEEIAEYARVDASITHHSEEAREGSVIVALLVAALARGVPKEKAIGVLSTDAVRPSAVRDRTFMASDMAFGLLKAPLEKRVVVLANTLGTAGHVVKTVPAAVFCFLVTESFSAAVELAVRGGGDSDTTAAVTGAIAGTYYGPSGTLPYCGRLEDSTRLIEMDRGLLAVGRPR